MKALSFLLASTILLSSPATQASSEWTIFQVAGPDVHDQRQPDVDGRRMVWADDRDYPSALDDEHEIYLYDDASKATERLTHAASSKSSPRIDGDLVVWSDNRRGNHDIYRLRLSDRTESLLTESPSNQTAPRLAFPWLVYQDDANGREQLDVWALNLETGAARQISTTTGRQFQPAVAGHVAAWVELSGGTDFSADSDVVGYDLATDETRRLTSGGRHSMPDIEGQTIIWQGAQVGSAGYDVFSYDWSAGAIRTMVADPSDQTAPRIADGTLAWLDYRDFQQDRARNGKAVYLGGDNRPTQRLSEPTKGDAQAVALDDALIAWINVRTDGGDGSFDLWAARRAGAVESSGAPSSPDGQASPAVESPPASAEEPQGPSARGSSSSPAFWSLVGGAILAAALCRSRRR